MPTRCLEVNDRGRRVHFVVTDLRVSPLDHRRLGGNPLIARGRNDESTRAIFWCPQGSQSGDGVGRQVLAGEGGTDGDEVGGRVLAEDLPADLACAGAEVTGLRCFVYRGAGHIPYATHPDGYAATSLTFIARGPMF